MKHIDLTIGIVKVHWRDPFTGKARWKRVKRYQPIPVEYGRWYMFVYIHDGNIVQNCGRMNDSMKADLTKCGVYPYIPASLFA